MRVVTWTIRVLVFLLLIAFAAKNVEPVTLRFYFDLSLHTPLVLALLTTVLRLRREISVLKRPRVEPPTVPPTFPPPV